jgi:acetyltransferase-like isoleucine patch superfamily enzyme
MTYYPRTASSVAHHALARTVDIADRRLLGELWKAKLRILGVELGKGVMLAGNPVVSRIEGSAIVIGDRVVLLSRSRATALGVARPVILRTLRGGAVIEIGNDCGLSGVAVCAACSVTIGERVLLGSDVMITDTDFHPVRSLARRYAPLPTPRAEDAVVIADDAFIGARSIILAGVTIGKGSVIGASSVVTRDVPDFVTAAGNPCRVIGTVNS